ncbi:hypothetical protein AU467_33835 [Mesorhizobium loti]|uniref:Uncharacterized protein n=1 Tax=Rhizobium loti TaxID=381 RepID=A0A101KM79_RHILI|nr:hypothetical protein AU467_33835 [Mesorhizobium loti]
MVITTRRRKRASGGEKQVSRILRSPLAMLSLSRNLGLVTGTAVMGAVFAFAVGTRDIGGAAPEAVATGMSVTFAVAAGLVLVAVMVAVVSGWRKQWSA